MSDDIKPSRFENCTWEPSPQDRIEALEARIANLRGALETIHQMTTSLTDPEHICGLVEVEARDALSRDTQG